MANKIQFADLPGRERARRFDGRDHGSTVSFFINRHPPGEGPNLHRHPYEETFVLEEGTATFTADGETVVAHGGDIVVVPPGAAHKFENTGDAPLRMVSIHAADHVIQEDLE